ncbi:MAG: YebC/PmpR family DNA-binding transcriptional regulator [Candidatus Zixiibacteriota bacterium]
MSGHNKWSSIKHKKGAADAKRGKLFSKLIREITVAARDGGGDIEFNPRLRSAVEQAKTANMPANNIENAIKRGTGELPGVDYEEMTYEGYGPNGVAIMINTLTDNKNRTVAEVRHIFDKYGGSMGESGCVNWMFDRKGMIIVKADQLDEEEMLDKALEAGAEDMETDEEFYTIYTEANALHEAAEELKKAGVKIENEELTYVPQNTIKVEGKDAEKVLRLMDAFEDQDDSQNVVTNADIDDEVVEEFHNQ